MYKIDEENCSGCGTCVDACPSGAIALTDDKGSINEDECVECSSCQSECPNDAIVEV